MGINQITREDIENFNAYFDEFGSALNGYQEIATQSAIYPGQGTPLGLAYVALKMNGEAGEFAEHVGKAMRDDGLVAQIPTGFKDDTYSDVDLPSHATLTDERRSLLIKEIGDVLWYLSAACNELDITLHYAASENLTKLCDRTERGKLQGSGDER